MRQLWKLAVVTAALGFLACSCIREKNFETYEPDPEAVSFVLEGVATRSEAPAAVQQNTYRLGTDNEGHLFTLMETVMEMGDLGAETAGTRGTPAFTENVQDVYGSQFMGAVYGTDGSLLDEGTYEAMEDGVRWRHLFGFDPWKVSDPLTFFLRMPLNPSGVSNLAYNPSAGTIAFDYATPEKASEQQDILFAKRTLTYEDYMSEFTGHGGANILFRHALTGIKFALSSARNSTTSEGGRSPEGEVQTFITKVEFTGLRDKGHAVYSQDDSEEQNTDIKDKYSSSSSFTWAPDATSTRSFIQTYSSDDIQDFNGEDASDAVHGPESFYAAGAERNLNKADASLTFWFIPQDMTADVKLKVTFYVWNGQSQGEEVTLTLNLGQEILARATETNKKWKAGQLRTFTLDPTIVDVSIDDEVSEDKLVKSNVKIVNTGNKDAYVRVAIVGNWIDPGTGTILMGTVQEDPGTGEQHFVAAPAWSETDTTQGTFVGLGGNGAWVRQSDGFWYFKQIVPPGKMPGETATGGTSIPLFETYTRTATPPIEGSALVLELVVQAVDASAGTDWESAWASVL